MDMLRVPFNRPSVSPTTAENVAQALAGTHASGDGPFTHRCHRYLERRLDVPKALLTTSCTHALEMAALLLDFQPGDEVIVPSFTFTSTINAFALRGAQPVFADIRPDTLNLDEALLEQLVTPRTKAIIPVHYAGVGCEMDVITQVAERHNLAVVEDNAHGLFGKYRGRHLGTFGSLATQSFHETKNISCGEGGALLINDRRYTEAAEIIREKGTDRSRFVRGQVDKYSWASLGSSYLPADLLAAVLYSQFEYAEQIQATRQQIWATYFGALRTWAESRYIRLPYVPDYCEQAYHMFYLILPSQEARQSLIGHLRTRGILSVFHYLPLHLSTMGRRYGGREGDCPITEAVSDRLLRLPFYNSMTEQELQEVIDALSDWQLPADMSNFEPLLTLTGV
ncbi:MAG TPA: dTDP-4-amino-4,6-dideoxygalactose transaminase [Thermomicrobiales bacterium]